MGRKARLPELRGTLLRPFERSDRLPFLRVEFALEAFTKPRRGKAAAPAKAAQKKTPQPEEELATVDTDETMGEDSLQESSDDVLDLDDDDDDATLPEAASSDDSDDEDVSFSNDNILSNDDDDEDETIEDEDEDVSLDLLADEEQASDDDDEEERD